VERLDTGTVTFGETRVHRLVAACATDAGTSGSSSQDPFAALNPALMTGLTLSRR
jgi:hypothetical protein